MNRSCPFHLRALFAFSVAAITAAAAFCGCKKPFTLPDVNEDDYPKYEYTASNWEEANNLAEAFKKYTDGEDCLVWETIQVGKNKEEIVITGFKDKPLELVVPETIDGKPVTQIGLDVKFTGDPIEFLKDGSNKPDTSKAGFFGCDTVYSVSLPPSIRKIGDLAFANCVNLREVMIPDGATVGKCAFAGSPNLLTVRLPKDMQVVEPGLFAGCKRLKSSVLPVRLETIGDAAYYHCESLPKLYVPNSVTRIGKSAYEGSLALSSVKLSEGVKKIEERAFKNCPAIREVYFSRNLREIGPEAFMSCLLLRSLRIEEGLKVVGERAFAECPRLDTPALPKSAKKVAENAFEKKGVVDMSHNPLDPAQNVEGETPKAPWDPDFKVPGPEDFEAPAPMTPGPTTGPVPELNPDVVVKPRNPLDNAKSYDCGGVTLYYKATGSAVSIVGFDKANAGGATLTIPDTIDGASVAVIGHTAFSGAPFEEIVLPSTLKQIESHAFADSKVKRLTIPKSVEKYGLAAFGNSPELEAIAFEEGTTVIPQNVLSNVKALKSVTIPSSVKKIGSHAFSSNQNLEFPTLPDGLEEIESGAFTGCKFQRVALPANIKKLGLAVFDLSTEVVVPAGSVTEKTAQARRIHNLTVE